MFSLVAKIIHPLRHLFPLVPRGVAPLALLLQLLEGRVPGPPVVDGGGHAGVARGEGGEVQLQVEEHLDIAFLLSYYIYSGVA